MVAQAGRAVVGAASSDRGLVECVDLRPALGDEGGVLPDRVRVQAVNPKHRVIHAIADAIAAYPVWDLADAAQSERGQRGIIKGGGAAHVGDAYAGVVDHD